VHSTPQWPQQAPPSPSRGPLLAALAVLAALAAAAATVWFLYSSQEAQKPAIAAQSSKPLPTIGFVLTKKERMYLEMAKAAGRADTFAGDDLGLLNYGRRACGLPPRLPDGALARNDSKPPTIDSILDGPPLQEGPVPHAVTAMCPKYIKVLIQGALSFTEGSWLVGPKRTEEQVEPGLYRTTRHVQECKWIRTTKTGKEITGGGGGRVTVRITKGDAKFVSNGCGNWGFERK
jgi:hypothetical protein